MDNNEPKLIFDSRRIACPHCGSSRGYAPATNIEGAGHCHRCGVTDFGDDAVAQAPEPETLPGLLDEIRYGDLPSRGLTLDTCRRFRYGVSTYNGQPCQVASYIDPQSGTTVLQKLRLADKSFVWLKGRPDADRFKGLFGQAFMKSAEQHNSNYDSIVHVTEGELDAMAVSQAMGAAYTVVSLPDGASSARKYCAANLDWLDAHDQVVLFFDQDEAGQKAVEEVLDLFTPGKVRVVRTDLGKDACDVLRDHGPEVLRKLMWDAPKHRPNWLVEGSDAIMEEVRSGALVKGVDYPWKGLNDMLGGIRPGTMTTVAAGSGAGKTLAMRHVALHAMKQGWKVGMLELESSTREGFLGLASLHLGRHLGDLEEEEMPYEEIEAFAKEYADRVCFTTNWGSMDTEELCSKLRFLSKTGCQLVVLDHISIVVSGLEITDERRALDAVCTKIRLLCESTGLAVMLVSHLRRAGNNQTSAEEGGKISGAMLRGSHSLLQLADACWTLRRDQSAEDPVLRHMPRIDVVKDRARGRTGPACALKFDPDSHRLTECSLPEEGCDFQ